jgi:hypothetical protein
MRMFAARVLACGGMAAAAGPLAAQQPPQTVSVPPPTFQMPGTPIGTPIVRPVGGEIPKAAPPAGAAVGTGAGGIPNPLDPRSPQPPGQLIDLKNVIAPYPGMPEPEPSFWQKLEQRWFALFQSDQPAQRPTTWTPGIGRRNREREKERAQMWWRRG